MYTNGLKRTAAVLLVAAALFVVPISWSLAQSTETVLHTFAYDKDGGFPFAGPTMDSQGNLYGVTYEAGATDGVCCGTVYELTPLPNGSWQYKVIFTFQGASRGEAPSGGLILDSAGNLYGTTQQGGAGLECGLVFELSPTDSGEWTKKDLHQFTHPYAPNHDGCTPSSYLVFDKAGNLYGTTQLGGGSNYNDCGETTWGCGTVFKLSPGANGEWKETLIHRFPEGKIDGLMPYAGLVFDSSGNLWGTTTGATGGLLGTAFRLTPNAEGIWKETALFIFTGDGTGYQTNAGLVADSAGNVYGTTYYGGLGNGTVFELTAGTDGPVEETVIHQFADCNQSECRDGALPFGGLAIDASGNLYGTTTQGGGAGSFCTAGNVDIGCGVVFKLAPAGNSDWNYSIVYAFPGGSSGAYLEDDRPFIDVNGNIFGTTFLGGDVAKYSKCPLGLPGEPGCGMVFEVTP